MDGKRASAVGWTVSGSSWAEARLIADRVLGRDWDGHLHRTPVWDAALDRAELALLCEETDGTRPADVRVPIIHALLDLYGRTFTAEELAQMVNVLWRIEQPDEESAIGA